MIMVETPQLDSEQPFFTSTRSTMEIKKPPSRIEKLLDLREPAQTNFSLEDDLSPRSASTKASYGTEKRKLEERVEFLKKELRRKDSELNQTKTYLNIVEKDRAACKQELKAYNIQTLVWKNDMESKMEEVAAMQEKMDFLAAENARLKGAAYENEDLRQRIDEIEAERQRAVDESKKNAKQLAEHNSTQDFHSNAAPTSSFPQLLCHNPSHIQAPVQRRSILPERVRPSEPEIRWHPKEEDDLSPSSPPAQLHLAADQYGPLQAWLRKQNMEAAFSGAYAVSSPSYKQTSPSSSPKASKRSCSSQYLECPKCESRFDANNFSAYRYHLEDCL